MFFDKCSHLVVLLVTSMEIRQGLKNHRVLKSLQTLNTLCSLNKRYGCYVYSHWVIKVTH